MHIVQVTHRFLPEQIGGIETYTLHLSLELSNRHRLQLFSCTHDQKRDQDYAEDMEYNGLEVRKVLCGCQSIYPASIAPFQNEAVVRHFERFISDLMPDIVHIQHSDTLPIDLSSVCKALGIPVVLTLHDYSFACPTEYLIDADGKLCERTPGSECLNCVIPTPFSRMSGLVGQKVLNGMASLYYRFARDTLEESGSHTLGEIRALRYRNENLKKKLLRADMLIAPSKLLKDKGVALGIPEEKFTVVLNGIKVGGGPEREKGRGEKIRFGFIGRAVPKKGVHVLVRAFEGLKSGGAEVRIHGTVNPGYQDELTSMLTRSDDVHFLGRFEPHQVYEILSEIDVLVIPSMCCENMPLVALEALSSRIPVIASDVGGLPELITDTENGFLFPMGDHAELGKRMKVFVDEPGALQRMMEAIGPVKSAEENAREVEDIYSKVVRGRS